MEFRSVSAGRGGIYRGKVYIGTWERRPLCVVTRRPSRGPGHGRRSADTSINVLTLARSNALAGCWRPTIVFGGLKRRNSCPVPIRARLGSISDRKVPRFGSHLCSSPVPKWVLSSISWRDAARSSGCPRGLVLNWLVTTIPRGVDSQMDRLSGCYERTRHRPY